MLFQVYKSKNIYQLASKFVSVALLFQVSRSKNINQPTCKGYLIAQRRSHKGNELILT